MCLGNVFSFLKILSLLAQKSGILVKKWFFRLFWPIFSQNNQKSEKPFPQYMYLDGFGKSFGDFVKKKKITLVQKFWREKLIFGDFSKIEFLAKISDYLKISCEISFLKINTFIYFTLLVFKLRQKLFSQNARVAPSLS